MGDRVEIGYVAKAHGIRGEIVVGLHDPASTALDATAELFVGGTAYPIQSVRHGNHGPLVALTGVADRDAAEALRGKPVEVAREVVAGADDILLSDLVGFAVQLADGTAWGTVVGLDMGPQHRLIIHDGELERLLPVVDPLIAGIDVAARVITATPPEGWPSSPVVRRR